MAKKSIKLDGYNNIMEKLIMMCNLTPYNENNKSVDFKEGDVVRCVYMDGLFKVFDLSQNSVFIYHIDDKGDIERVDPRFIEKVQTNQGVMKVLYGD